jgi:hypothetical protein
MAKRVVPFLTLLLAACGSTIESSDDGAGAGGSGTGAGGEQNTATTTNTGSTGSGSTSSSTFSTGTGGAPPACDPPSSPIAFELGTGEKCFERLTPGGTVPMMEGPQGGYHLWVALGCTDCGAQAHVKFGVDDPATGAPIEGTGPTEQFVDLKGDSWPQRAGIIQGLPGLSWDPEYSPPLPEGTPVRLWIQVFDAGSSIIHEASFDLLIGETLVWDPCAEDPNHPLCQTG